MKKKQEEGAAVPSKGEVEGCFLEKVRYLRSQEIVGGREQADAVTID